MKATLFCLLVFFTCSLPAQQKAPLSQAKPAVNDSFPEVYSIVEEAPQYPGGPAAINKFIQQNLRYPPLARETQITGKCILKLVVTSDESIKNIKVLKGVAGCSECDEEAIRVVSLMPAWIPAKMNGKAVSAWYNLPVNFKLR